VAKGTHLEMNAISSMQCLSAAPHIEEDTVLSILMYDTYHRVLWVWVGIWLLDPLSDNTSHQN